MYEDEQWEELTKEEVLSMICETEIVPTDSMNSCIFHYLNKYSLENPVVLLNGFYARQLCLPLVEYIDEDHHNDWAALSLCNRFVKKLFNGGGTRFGFVVAFDNPYYMVSNFYSVGIFNSTLFVCFSDCV
jgi:hypothetical protein